MAAEPARGAAPARGQGRERLRLCFVIQRFGLEVAGGSELHCRWLAGRLARRHDVRVVTTCALDYLEWRNHYPPGPDRVDGLPVMRHPVRRPRDEHRFALQSDLVFHEEHSRDEERQWVVENGPECPELVRSLRGLRDVDLFIFYSYRYYQTFFGLPTVADRAVLVPTAEEDPAIELPVFGDLFRAARGIVYLTPEERSLVQGVSGNTAVPSVVVGSGINVPEGHGEVDVRARFGLHGPYVLYVGRIDRNKGADRLFTYWQRLAEERKDLPPLVLVGRPALAIPEHPKIRHLGFVPEEEKFALLAGSLLLVLPSPYESLSVIVLEAWAMGRPVLVNSACRVLEGQCVRSGGGLFYRGYSEFAEALRRLLDDEGLRGHLGEAGRRYVAAEYDWDVVERRTEAFLRGLVS
jgi:glycosyltransferase involved in cell wall biosynthesis